MNAVPLVLKAGDRTVLAVPAEWTHVAWLALPARNGVQARAAARELLSTQVASPRDSLHVATSAESDPSGNRLVVGVDRQVMHRWLDDARAAGVDPDAVVPDALLLPLPAGDERTVHVLERDGRWLVRGVGLAFAADAALAAMLVGDRPIAIIDTGNAGREIPLEGVLSRRALSPPVDLRQDAFANGSGPSPRRRLRWLAAAALLAPLVMPAASAARQAWAANVLEETARAEAEAVLGERADDPLAATRARRTGLETTLALPRAVDALSTAVAARPGTRIETLHASPANGLVVAIVHGGTADLAAIDASLAGAGLSLAILGERRLADGRQRSELRVEDTR